MDVQRRLRELFDYLPVTGEFLDKKGNPKGHIQRSNGRRYIYFDGRKVLACRVAYLWIKGEWPPCNLTHKNGDRSDDRWVNLKLRAEGGYFQTVRYESGGKYSAQVSVAGRITHLGYYPSSVTAKAVVRKAMSPEEWWRYAPDHVRDRILEELAKPPWA